MKIHQQYNSIIAKLFQTRGITIYPFIFYRQKKEEITDRLFRHELQHIYQVRKEGWLKFYIKYLYYAPRGHANNPYENDARAHQYDPLTDSEKALKENG